MKDLGVKKWSWVIWCHNKFLIRGRQRGMEDPRRER